MDSNPLAMASANLCFGVYGIHDLQRPVVDELGVAARADKKVVKVPTSCAAGKATEKSYLALSISKPQV